MKNPNNMLSKPIEGRMCLHCPVNDWPEIKKSIEAGFEMKLRDGYWEDQDWLDVYLWCEGDLIKGGVIMLSTPYGVRLLSKIWVEKKYHGQGIASKMWKFIECEYPEFFWRSLKSNTCVDWYLKNADSYIEVENRNVYFKNDGLKSIFGQADKMAVWAFNLPFDFDRIK